MPASELPDPQREILNIDEAAAYLGVSTKTFQRVLRAGEMPGRKVGREWKFSRRALEGWIGKSLSRDFLDLEDRVEEEPAPAAAAAAPSTPRAAVRKTGTRGAGGAFEAEED